MSHDEICFDNALKDSDQRRYQKFKDFKIFNTLINNVTILKRYNYFINITEEDIKSRI